MESLEIPTTIPVNIEDEMKQSYMDYAMSVIVGRALPDVRDGLKPVQRRVLYAMHVDGLASNKKTSKCAGVVGGVIRSYHPHGDIPVYDALVRLAQPWSLRYPLVEGQGNFGSIDGDPAAAYRYTECRMTVFAERLLQDIDKETVNFSPNFDDSTVEPDYLPANFPNLLVNGADGIAVGMATHIPPHNLSEVINGTIALLENPQIGLEELMTHIPGPDLPTGGIIYGGAPIRSAYATGRGIIQVRAKTAFETIKGKSRENEAIVVTEIPYQVNKSRLVERIAELINEKHIEGISHLRDESDRKGMRIVIELRRDATREVVLNQLFKMTPMQTSFGVINLAIVEGQPVVCSLIELIRHFLGHRHDVVVRRTEFELRKAQERMHLLEGFRTALLNLDAVIELIKKSETPKEAKEALMAKYSLSELQSQAILDLRLQKLTGMERLAIEQEYNELSAYIKRLLTILADPKEVDAIIKTELREVQEKHGDARRTQLIEDAGEINVEDLIEDEEMVVSITHQGYIKRTSSSVYRSQKRGGKGVAATSQKDDDFVEHLFICSTLSDLLVFTNLGRLYWQKVYEIPEAGRTARGRALVNLLSLKTDEVVTAILPVKEFAESKFVVMATRCGVIKKVGLMEFSRSRRSGIVACAVDEGDSLISAAITGGEDDVLLASREGMAIRFNESQVRAMGRAARGVRGINLEGEDKVVGATIVRKLLNGTANAEKEMTLLTVCENGYGKRSLIEDYRAQNRGGKGLIDIKADDRNGMVIGTCAVDDSSELMLITSSGKIIRFKAKDMSVIGRNTRGVRLVDLEPGEKVVAVAPLMDDAPEE